MGNRCASKLQHAGCSEVLLIAVHLFCFLGPKLFHIPTLPARHVPMGHVMQSLLETLT